MLQTQILSEELGLVGHLIYEIKDYYNYISNINNFR